MSESTNEPARPFRIVCPLRFEQARLQRFLPPDLQPDCCGPGASAAAAWVRGLPKATAQVVLVGVAGGLVDECPPGHVCPLGEIVGEDGGERQVSDAASRLRGGHALVRGVSVERSATTPKAKRVLAQRSGASVVDLESLAFAKAAAERGIPWLAVRIVSDGVDDTLPADIDEWIAPDGRTRLRVVLAHILRRPDDLPRLRRLAAAASSRAYRAVAALLTASAHPNEDAAASAGANAP